MAALVAMVCLAGCADNDSFPKDRCTLGSIGDMEVLSQRGVPIIPVTLNDEKVAMIVDTGSGDSMLSGSIADKLNLSRSMSNVIVHGADGSAFASVTKIERLGVGDGQIRDLLMMITPASMGGTIAHLPMAGLFGADFLYSYDVLFDLPHHQFSLFREFHCKKSADIDLGWPNGFYVLPFEEGTPDHPNDTTEISLPIVVNGHRIQATLDSGASHSTITYSDAKALGLTRADLERDRRVTYSGIVGDPRKGWVHRFASLEIGPERFYDVPLEVIDENIPTLLGADFIRTHRMLISYRRDKIFIERRALPVSPSPQLGQPKAAGSLPDQSSAQRPGQGSATPPVRP